MTASRNVLCAPSSKVLPFFLFSFSITYTPRDLVWNVWSIARWIFFFAMALYLFCFMAYHHLRKKRRKSSILLNRPNESCDSTSPGLTASHQQASVAHSLTESSLYCRYRDMRRCAEENHLGSSWVIPSYLWDILLSICKTYFNLYTDWTVYYVNMTCYIIWSSSLSPAVIPVDAIPLQLLSSYQIPPLEQQASWTCCVTL